MNDDILDRHLMYRINFLWIVQHNPSCFFIKICREKTKTIWLLFPSAIEQRHTVAYMTHLQAVFNK